MLIAKKTAYRCFDGDYGIRCKDREGDWFICGDLLWKMFPFSGPPPKAIRIELHDTPAKDRVEIANSPREDCTYYACCDDAGHRLFVYCDGVEHQLFVAGYEWLLPHLEKHGTVYAELWY